WTAPELHRVSGAARIIYAGLFPDPPGLFAPPRHRRPGIAGAAATGPLRVAGGSAAGFRRRSPACASASADPFGTAGRVGQTLFVRATLAAQHAGRLAAGPAGSPAGQG